jgi:hypothetical protein
MADGLHLGTLFKYFRRAEGLSRARRAGSARAGQPEPKAASRFAAKYLRAVLGVGAYLSMCIAVLISVAYFFGILDRTTVFSGEDVLTQNGHAYTLSLQKLLPELRELIYPADSNGRPTISSLEVQEDGRALSPAHALHADIAEKGVGRYSHWNGYLIFSTSDNSDPRSNGRVYRLFIRPNLHNVGLFAVSIAGLGLFCTLFFYKDQARQHSLALWHSLRRLNAIASEILSRRSIVIARDWVVISILTTVETYFLFKFGMTPWRDGDGWAYVRLADQLPTIREWGLLPIVSAGVGDNCWSSELRASLAACSPYVPDWRDMYVFLFRMPGYPIVILICKWFAGVHWQSILVIIQHLVALIAAYVVFRVSSRISCSRLCGFLCAVLFVFSNRLQYDRAILTDSLCTSTITILVCISILMWDRRKLPSSFQLFVGGCLLALLFFVRETFLVVAVAAVPLIAIMLSPVRTLPARLARLATLYAPLCAVSIIVLTWNYARTGYVFVTTQPLSAGLYSAILLEREGSPVFTGDTVLDRVARQTLNSYDFAEAMEINRRLLLAHNLSGPEQANLMQTKYFEIWFDHPYEMILTLINNLKVWPYLFLVTDKISNFQDNNTYYKAVFLWGYFCGIVCPALIMILSIFTKPARRLVQAALALLVFALLPTVGYAAFAIELRYLIFATAPLLLIFALSVRSVGLAAALVYEHVRSMAYGTSLVDVRGRIDKRHGFLTRQPSDG